VTSAVWELTIPAHRARPDPSGSIPEFHSEGFWGAIPDFNGDGFGDLVVGAKVAGVNTADEMRVFPGGPSGPAATPSQILRNPTGALGFGDEAGSAGDLDGDGFGDLVVWTGFGAPASVTVFRGTPQGPSSPVTFPGPAASSGQMRVLSAGDVNGDGYGDLLVGGNAFAQLFLGGAAGVNTTPSQTLPSLTPAGSTKPSDARWPIGGGDFNGDGFPDAAVSGLDGTPLLYFGDGHTLVPRPDIVLPRDPGFVSLAGDFNHDGLADLNTGPVIWTGGPTGLTEFFVAREASTYQGVGDINGDGFSDELASVFKGAGVIEGQRLYFGVPVACPLNACSNFVPVLPPGSLSNISPPIPMLKGGLGDVNGDGFGDFAYSVPSAGAVYLFLGSAKGPPPDPSMTITAAPGFGYSMARL
jgi:hypothetical protein